MRRWLEEGKLNELGNIVRFLGSTKGLLQVSNPEFKVRHNPVICFFQPFLALQVQT